MIPPGGSALLKIYFFLASALLKIIQLHQQSQFSQVSFISARDDFKTVVQIHKLNNACLHLNLTLHHHIALFRDTFIMDLSLFSWKWGDLIKWLDSLYLREAFPSKVVVVVAGQDPLLHYTTLCLFCLKVFWRRKRARRSFKTFHALFSCTFCEQSLPQVLLAV